MPGTFDRDGAFSMELGEDKENAIQHMLTLNECLYIFSTKKIFQVRTADDVDPDRASPETRHSYQEIYPIGCNNSFVARSIIQAKQIFDGVILRPELAKERLLNAVWEATQLLLQCENAHFRIYNDAMSLLAEIDDVIEKSKSQTTIPTLPQVADLKNRLAPFLVAPNASSRRRTPYSPSFTDHPITARTSRHTASGSQRTEAPAKKS